VRAAGQTALASPAVIIGTASCKLPTKNIENNPMQSSLQGNLAVAGLRDLATTFDTSGKSPVAFYHPAICKTPWSCPHQGMLRQLANA